MEVAGAVFRPATCFSSGTAGHSSLTTKHRYPNRKSVAAFACLGSNKFSDKGHLQYYDYSSGPKMAMKETKKKLKLLKGLSKNLSDFSDMGFGLSPNHGLDQQVKGQIISEATEVLLLQLQKLKAEKLESKRRKKEQKAKKKASMATLADSSSSSSSSESDCENVMSTTQLQTITIPDGDQESASNHGGLSKKIEICMGGKCKKSGGELLLENFEKAVGGEATVVGCKCMGKCRDGPNVRVQDSPVCIGVGLEDVDMIVTSLFGGGQKCSSGMVPV